MKDENRIYYIYVGHTKVEVPYEIYWAHHQSREEFRADKKRYNKKTLSLDRFAEKGIQPKLAKPESDLLDTMLQQETLNTLYEALGSLSEEERRLIYLRFYCELTQTKIAPFLHCGQSSVSRREAKILRKLRGLIEKK